MARADMISIVEQAYDLRGDDKQWLQNIVDTFQRLYQFELGMLGYFIELRSDGPHFIHPVASAGAELDLVGRIKKLSALLEGARQERAGLFARAQASVIARSVQHSYGKAVGRLAYSEYDRLGPTWVHTLGIPAKDVFVLGNHDVDGMSGLPLTGGTLKICRFTPTQRENFGRLSAHIKAAKRLRERLRDHSAAVELPSEGAILDANGKVIEADGEAKADEALEALSERSQLIDRARTQKLGRETEALKLWQGLVRGEWSMVERHDTDGKRFIVAHRNPEDVRDPRGLSDIECRVVGLAVRGYSDSLIGYHLGLAAGTVSSHLSRAMRKLGLRTRAELVRTLGVHYPVEQKSARSVPG